MVLALVRGDHRLNEIKLAQRARRRASARRRRRRSRPSSGPPGFIGPVGAEVPVIKDAAIQGAGYFAGANRPDAHLIGVEPGRDFSFEELDIRAVEAGDLSPGGDPIEIETAIEVGNIFKLGTRYSEPLGATYLDPDGKERPIVMGSYGIGPARIVAAAIEQNADEKGIVWPRALAPWQVHLVAPRQGRRRDRRGRRAALRGARGGRARARSTTTARPGPGRSSPTPSCSAARCGSWSASAPSPRARSRRRSGATGAEHRLAGRRRGAARRRDPRRARAERERRRGSKRAAVRDRPLRARAARRPAAGAPLHPWTIPNLVGYLRLAAIPVFCRARLRLRRRPRHGAGAALPRDRRSATTSTASSPAPPASTRAWGRCSTRSSTGSRCSPAPPSAGTSSCCRAGRWRCSPCARWSPWCSPSWRCAAGVDLEINWIGRIGVFLVFGGIFWSMVVDWWIIRAGFVVGVGDRRCWRPSLYVRAALGRHPQRASVQPSSST